MRKHEGWSTAQPVDIYYKEGAKHSASYREMRSRLTHIETDIASFGDWQLYKDEEGNYWEEYYSVGD